MSVTAQDPLATIRSRQYVVLLIAAAILGAPISAASYWFLKLTAVVHHLTFLDLPRALGFSATPIWWPLPPLFVAGVVVALTIRYLPGRGGHSPADGFKVRGFSPPQTLPGIAVAALASIGLGAVVGPEGPLVALGGGLAYLAVHLVRREVPSATGAVLAATGSFAALSTLLGTPLAGAFLLMEASGLGAMAITVLLPGLLASAIGALIFTGLGSLTGYGTLSLTIPNLPHLGAPTASEFGYALAVGLVAALLCAGIRGLALRVRPVVESRLLLLTPLVGLGMAGLAIAYAAGTGHPTSDVLFSGQAALPALISGGAKYSVVALLLLIACKGLAYAGALSSFRGGPTFPAMFIGAAGGIALSHLPGIGLVAGVAIGLAAMTTGMLRLPLTSVLLTTLFLGSDGYNAIPLAVVAVVTCYLVIERVSPTPPAAVPAPRPAEAPAVTPDVPAR